MKQWFSRAEILLIVILALFPLLGDLFPYRLNVFLSYEGAYRLYLGHVPYRDFGLPMGYMYWVLPALFFKIFGPSMISLVKAQVFINIVSGLSFRGILHHLSVKPGIRLVSVLLFCISYSFLNYWPWYNHSVIMYELVGLAFLTRFLFDEHGRWKKVWLFGSGMFMFFSFFTKQDAGAMAFLIGLFIILYNAFIQRKWMQLLVYNAGFLLTAVAMIAPVWKYRFNYWFNFGQPPHTSRVSVTDFTQDFFYESQMLKFYVFLIALLLLARMNRWRDLFYDRHRMIFALLTVGILFEAALFQVTSYFPADNNIFYHSFAIAFILTLLAELLPVNFSSWKIITACAAGVMLWWSSVYWKFVEKYLFKPEVAQAPAPGVVNKKTYVLYKPDTSDVPMHLWRTVPLKSFDRILLPGPTVDGINRILQMDVIRQKKNPRVLNMTELTPLARELPFELEKGPHYPLWYHLGVGMFQKETDMFCRRIENNYYDLVFFEYIPYLNNFFPFQVRDHLLKYYQRVDVFTAPRKPSLQAWVEVYVRKTG